jgi:hypothetical protein
MNRKERCTTIGRLLGAGNVGRVGEESRVAMAFELRTSSALSDLEDICGNRRETGSGIGED